jgi:hypothetical protein
MDLYSLLEELGTYNAKTAPDYRVALCIKQLIANKQLTFETLDKLDKAYSNFIDSGHMYVACHGSWIIGKEPMSALIARVKDGLKLSYIREGTTT